MTVQFNISWNKLSPITSLCILHKSTLKLRDFPASWAQPKCDTPEGTLPQGWSGISSPLPRKEYYSGQHHTRDAPLLVGICILVRGHRKAGHGAKWPFKSIPLSPGISQTYKWIKQVVSACKFQPAHTWHCQEITVRRQPQEHLSSFTALTLPSSGITPLGTEFHV